MACGWFLLMSSLVKIYALFLGSAFLLFAGGLQGLLLAVRGADEHFSLLALGLIGTGWSVGFITGSITVPMLVKRVGHIRAFSIMAAIGTITILCNLLLINDIAWIVMRAFSGFCFAGAAMIVESWLNEVAENKSRGTIFSVYTTINMTASTLGQLAMSMTGVSTAIPFIVGAISFICAILPPALTSTPQPKPLASARLDVLLLYKTSPLAVIAAFAVGMANGTFGTLAPVFGHDQGLDAAGVAYLFAVTAVLGAIAQVPFGRLSDTMDRRLVLVFLSGTAAVVGFLALITNPRGGWWMVFEPDATVLHHQGMSTAGRWNSLEKRQKEYEGFFRFQRLHLSRRQAIANLTTGYALSLTRKAWLTLRRQSLEETRLVQELYARELRDTIFTKSSKVEVPAQVAKRPL